MRQRIRSDWVLVGALTAIGLALRLPGLWEGLWGDEVLAYQDLDNSFRGMLEALHSGPENSPPLFFALAWFSNKLGSDVVMMRLPSLVLGTATIPLVAWLGSRTVGRWPGVAAAAFVTIAPPAVYYSAEGRPYATLMFLAVVSVLLLLEALERRATGWWVLWGLSLAAIVYTHYTGVFVVAVQVGWALWVTRPSPRGVLIATASGALAFAPWLPFVKGDELGVYSSVAKFIGLTRADSLVTWLTGLPYEHPSAVPGRLALALFGLALVAGAAGLLLRRFPDGPPPRTTVLVLVLAAVTPVGVYLYSLVATDLFIFPRNLLASLPFAALAIGWLLLRLPALAAGPALAALGAGLAIGSVATLSDSHSRPDFPPLADYLDATAGPRDMVVYQSQRGPAAIFVDALNLYLDKPHPVVYDPDPSNWVNHLRSWQLVVVSAGGVGWDPRRPLPGRGLTMVEGRSFDGLQPLAATVYRRDPLHGPNSYSVRGDRLVPAHGPSLPIRARGVEGLIEPLKALSKRTYLYSGWAHHGEDAVDKIVVLAGSRVVYADAPYILRRDVAPDPTRGEAFGFDFKVPRHLLEEFESLTAYALFDGVAYRLDYRCEPGKHQPIPCPQDAVRE